MDKQCPAGLILIDTDDDSSMEYRCELVDGHPTDRHKDGCYEWTTY